MNSLDVTPLSQPVNVFRWSAAQLRHQLQQASQLYTRIQAGQASQQEIEAYKLSAAAFQRMQELIPWLEHLAEKINYQHNNPAVIFAISNLVVHGEERSRFLAMLQEVDRLTKEAAMEVKGPYVSG